MLRNKVAFDVVVWQEGDVFVSQCLNVDVSSYGDSVEDALESLKEALEARFENASKLES